MLRFMETAVSAYLLPPRDCLFGVLFRLLSCGCRPAVQAW